MLSHLQWNVLLGMGLFVYASYQQHQAHRILANLRQSPAIDKASSENVSLHLDRKNNVRLSSYSIPYGSWFQYVASPHYFAEILIYTSFLIMDFHQITRWCVWAWVVVNLAITARQTWYWYEGWVGKEKWNKFRRAILIPSVW